MEKGGGLFVRTLLFFFYLDLHPLSVNLPAAWLLYHPTSMLLVSILLSFNRFTICALMNLFPYFAEKEKSDFLPLHFYIFPLPPLPPPPPPPPPLPLLLTLSSSRVLLLRLPTNRPIIPEFWTVS
ncbi:MAG: hypothetical protein JOS17DRAFT_753828 [Linnemannia elongata]|nr:MAG: hypothetical protein JOS17DRAFT_753828 [Linnemannia elongata]